MIHRQETHGPDTPRFYFYCACGVCGPLRVSHARAVVDERAHDAVCSSRAVAA